MFEGNMRLVRPEKKTVSRGHFLMKLRSTIF